MTLYERIQQEHEKVHNYIFRNIEVSEVRNIIDNIKRDNPEEE